MLDIQHWSHFEYESGTTPYIAKNDDERDYILHQYSKKGVKVTEKHSKRGSIGKKSVISMKFYLVHDKNRDDLTGVIGDIYGEREPVS